MATAIFGAFCECDGAVTWHVDYGFRAPVRCDGAVTWAIAEPLISRTIAGRPALVNDAPIRGTHGLMPGRWGVVEAFDLDDSATEFRLMSAGRVFAAGQDKGRLTVTATLRLSRSAAMPFRGEQFMHRWQGADRLFTVWNVSPVYGVRTLRKVDITAIHELDIGNAAAVEAAAEVLTLEVS